jgi:hypothetical protein
MSLKSAPLDEAKLLPSSKELLKQFLEWKPGWKEHCSMEEGQDGWALVIKIPSPTGDTERDLMIYFADQLDDITLGFGAWHTHGKVWIRERSEVYRVISILDGAKLIVASELVGYSFEPGDKLERSMAYLSSRWDLEDILTQKGSTGRIRTKSWDGKNDRVITLADLESLNRGH